MIDILELARIIKSYVPCVTVGELHTLSQRLKSEAEILVFEEARKTCSRCPKYSECRKKGVLKK